MDFSSTFEQKRRLCSLLLLLLLTGLQPVLSTEDEMPKLEDHDLEAKKLNCTIISPDYVTVGVPSTVECVSSCSQCTYSMSLNGQAAQGQGNVLAFTINIWVEDITVTCTVTDDNNQITTATKKLQVLAGPFNVTITGPGSINPALSHTYSCYAYCRPSCSYAWRMDQGPWVSGQGNVISVQPQEIHTSTAVTCKATNTVSGLFVTATRDIDVMSGPSDVHIEGPDVVEIAEKYKYVCRAKCHPSCRYVSSVNNQTVRGGVVEMMLEHPLSSVTLKCEAQNTASKKTAMAVRTVRVAGMYRNLSTRPQGASVMLLMVAAIFTASSL